MVSMLDMFGFDNLFNFGGFISKTLYIVGIIFLGIIVIGGMYFYSKHRKKINPNRKEIWWWEEIHNDMIPSHIDFADEITMPGTNLKVFYVKDKDLWLPRFTRAISKNLFFVCITENREIVNFTLKTLSSDLKEAGLNFDHTDMRWAAENTREFIKRNYRDKATTWWKEYKEIISIAILIVLNTAAICVIIWMLSGIVGDIGAIAGQVADSAEKVKMCSSQSSGIASGV